MNYWFRIKWGVSSITFHTLKYWRKKRNEDDPIPFYKINVVRPYPSIVKGTLYKAIGNYIFPFVYRKYVKVNFETGQLIEDIYGNSGEISEVYYDYIRLTNGTHVYKTAIKKVQV
jgi:hypothetical protein